MAVNSFKSAAGKAIAKQFQDAEDNSGKVDCSNFPAIIQEMVLMNHTCVIGSLSCKIIKKPEGARP